MSKLSLLRRKLVELEIPAMLVTHMPNVYWLTGFTGSSGVAIVTADDAVFVSDSRYTVQAAEEVAEFAVRTFASPVRLNEFLGERLQELQISETGFDRQHVAYGTFQQWQEKWEGVTLTAVDDPCESLRMIKTDEEIEAIRAACRLADDCVRFLVERLEIGKSERSVLRDIHDFLWSHGSEASFAPIVVSGERSARPHGKPSDKPLQRGDLVTMDLGARLHGLCSDITRTVVMGAASERQREVYNCVLEAQQAAIDALVPGADGKDIDAMVRERFAEHGLNEYFGHGLGHGLGIEVHDPGRLSPTTSQAIEVGHVWTIEPGVYIEGFGGIRIEDDVLVTESGPETLTQFPKELIEVPV